MCGSIFMRELELYVIYHGILTIYAYHNLLLFNVIPLLDLFLQYKLNVQPTAM